MHLFTYTASSKLATKYSTLPIPKTKLNANTIDKANKRAVTMLQPSNPRVPIEIVFSIYD